MTTATDYTAYQLGREYIQVMRAIAEGIAIDDDLFDIHLRNLERNARSFEKLDAVGLTAALHGLHDALQETFNDLIVTPKRKQWPVLNYHEELAEALAKNSNVEKGTR